MAAAPAASGGFWQKKQAGLPLWAWALIVGGGAGALILWSRLHSSAPATSSTQPSQGASPGGFGVGGYGGTGVQPGGGETPPMPVTMPSRPPSGPIRVPISSQPTPSSPGNPSLPFQVQSGSGWWAGGSNYATDTPQQQQQAMAAAQAAGPITDASGNEYEWIDPQEYQSIQGSGTQVYYEVLPGVFLPVPANMATLAPGTPLYMQVPSGTSANPSVPATAGA